MKSRKKAKIDCCSWKSQGKVTAEQNRQTFAQKHRESRSQHMLQLPALILEGLPSYIEHTQGPTCNAKSQALKPSVRIVGSGMIAPRPKQSHISLRCGIVRNALFRCIAVHPHLRWPGVGPGPCVVSFTCIIIRGRQPIEA